MLKQIFAVRDYPLLPQENFSFKHKIFTIFKLYGILLLILIFIYFPVHKLADYLVENVLHYKSLNLQYKTHMEGFLKKLGYIPAIIYICLIGPIIEEVIFRLPLSFKKNHIAFSLAFALFLFSGLLPFTKILNLNLSIWSTLAIRALAAGCLFFVVWKLIPKEIRLKESYKIPIIILSMCVFGLMHIGNYSPVQWPIFWIYPLYILPQFLIGWFQTFVRFKYGFVWGIALHCLVNSVSMGLYFAYANHTATQQTKTIKVKAKPQIIDTAKKTNKKDGR